MTDRAKVYRAAAKLIEDGKASDSGGGSCCAITQAFKTRLHHSVAYDLYAHDPIVTKYVAIFRPEGGYHYWGDQWGYDKVDCRILALCFMAAMVEAGDA